MKNANIAIYLDKETLQLITFKGKKIGHIQVVSDDWQSQLPQLLKSIAKKHGNQTHLVLGDDIAQTYFKSIEAPEGEVQEKVAEFAQKHLGNTLDDSLFDYTVRDQAGDVYHLQILLVNKEYSSLLKQAFSQVNLEVQSVQSLSYLIAQQIPPQKPALAVYGGVSKLAFIAFNHAVVISQMVSKDPATHLAALHVYAKEKHELETTITYTIGTARADNPPKEHLKIEPFDYIAKKQEGPLFARLKGVLNQKQEGTLEEAVEELGEKEEELPEIQAPAAPTPPSAAAPAAPLPKEAEKDVEVKNADTVEPKIQKSPVVTNTPKIPHREQAPKKKKKFPWIIFGSILIILAGMGAAYLYVQPDLSSINPAIPVPTATPTPTPEATPTPTPTPEPISLSDYTFQVLNGSGTPGEAGKVQGMLEDEGIEDIEVGNADSFDYEATEIQLKEDAPENLYTEIKAILEDEYEVEQSTDSLDEDSEYDVLIIIGSTTTDEESEN